MLPHKNTSFRTNFVSFCALILALAAFINSWLSNSPIAFGAPDQQDASAQPAYVSQPNTNVQTLTQTNIALQGAVFTVPSYIGYQGVLRDGEGRLITNPVTVTFRIYDNVTTAPPANVSECTTTNSCKWAEVHRNVTVRDGRFSVLLGNVDSPISPNLMNSPDRFVGIQVDGYQEMQPRQRFSSVPYAMWSERAAALGAPDGDPVNAVIVDYGGNVGIGTTNPSAKLQIAGNTQIDGSSSTSGNMSIGGSINIVGGADVSGHAIIRGGQTVQGSLAYENADHRLNFSTGGDVDIYTDNDSLWINSVNGDILLNPWANAGNVHVEHSLNVNGNLTVGGEKPIFFQRFYGLGAEQLSYDTGIPDWKYNCGIAGWAVVDVDVQENFGGDYLAETFRDGGTWRIKAKYHWQDDSGEWYVTLLCVDTRLSEIRGGPFSAQQ